MKVFVQLITGAALLSTALAAPVGNAAETRDLPIHILPNIKKVGVYAVDPSDTKRDTPPIHILPNIKSVDVYAVDPSDTKRDTPPIHILPNIKSVGVYAKEKA